MYDHGLLAPVAALILWTLVIWIWMYATRLPAMSRSGVDPQAAKHPGSLDGLPSWARQVADNYNHLMEQPTIFYAAALALHVQGETNPINIGLAWAYVTLRVAHSLVQCTVNIVALRFMLFTLSTLALMALAVHLALALFH
jgi:hypothetical protein